MDDKVYENLKYTRSSLSGQLRMMEHSNPPSWATWALVAWATSLCWLPILGFLLK